MSKSGDHGTTVMVRVGGLGSVLPAASITVIVATYVPGFANVTLPGVRALEVAGDPPVNTHEYWAAPVAAANDTDWPGAIVTSDTGAVIVPAGGGVA
jgi:hypothetical protein